MAKCPDYYNCELATNGDYVSPSCEDVGIWPDWDKQMKECLRLKRKWERFRYSLKDWIKLHEERENE